MTSAYAIFVGDGAWQAVRAGDGQVERAAIDVPSAGDEPSGEAVREALASLGWSHEAVTVALPSPWCLAASIATTDLGRGPRHKALAYRLEEHLPVSVEDVVADFVEASRGAALGVCAQRDRLVGLVSRIEEAGVRVEAARPAALLAAAWALQQKPGVEAVVRVRRDGEGLEFDAVQLHKNRPVGWWWLGGDRDGLLEQIEAAADGATPSRLALLGGDEELADAIARRGFTVEPLARDGDEAAALGLQAGGGSRAAGWIDFRPGCGGSRARGGRRDAAARVVAALVLRVTLSGAAHWRGMQYEESADAFASQQIVLFRKALPGQRVPGHITARLRSQRQKLAALGGQASQEAGVVQPTSALQHLQAVLAALPPDVRWRIESITIESDTLGLVGQTRTHADAERIAALLADSGAYTVEQPRTGPLRDRGVSFQLGAAARAGAEEGGR